jgi:hypothetical protein
MLSASQLTGTSLQEVQMLAPFLGFFGFGALACYLTEVASRDEVPLVPGALALLGAVLSADCCIISGVVWAFMFLTS